MEKKYRKKDELVKLFSEIGINYNHLNPTIFKVILKEAIAADSAKIAFDGFVNMRNTFVELGYEDPESFARIMVMAYKERDEKF